MKKIILVAILAMNLTAAFSQIEIAIISGAHWENSFGARVGVDVHIPIDNKMLSFIPGAYWSIRVNEKKGDNLKMIDKANFVSVPLRMGLTIGKNSPYLETTFFAGPYFAYGVGCKTKCTLDYDGQTNTYEYGSFSDKGLCAKRFDVGVNLGVNFTIFNHLLLGGFFEYGFMKVKKNTSTIYDPTIQDPFVGNNKNTIGGGVNIGCRF